MFKRKLVIYLVPAILMASVNGLHSQVQMWNLPLDKKGKQELTIELDHYYSCIYYTLGLTEKPIPRQKIKYEGEVYWYMLRNFYLPRYVLFEASAYPLPLAGVYVKRHAGNFYYDSEVVNGLNLVKAATTGFPEPYAASIFLGNVANFVRGEGETITGKGFSGLLFSYGSLHIVDNIMVQDNWFETELKLKGTDFRDIHKLSWSYSIGLKKHTNPDISDQFYISVKRNRIDYGESRMHPFLGFFVRNTEQQFRVDFDMKQIHRGEVTSVMFLVGKNIPIGEGAVTFSLRLGGLKVFRQAYSGELEQDIDKNWSFLIRPTVYLKLN